MNRCRDGSQQLAGGQSHSYSLRLTAGQYTHLITEQNGSDVVVSIFDSQGKKLVEMDGPSGSYGREHVRVIAAERGNHRVEVRSTERANVVGRYAIRLEELRDSTPQNADRIAAQSGTKAEQISSESATYSCQISSVKNNS